LIDGWFIMEIQEKLIHGVTTKTCIYTRNLTYTSDSNKTLSFSVKNELKFFLCTQLHNKANLFSMFVMLNPSCSAKGTSPET